MNTAPTSGGGSGTARRTMTLGHAFPRDSPQTDEEGEYVRYAITVGGTVEKAFNNPYTANQTEEITDGNTATGIVVSNPGDSWHIEGPIESIEWATTHPEGELAVYIDGEQQDLSQYETTELTGREFESKYKEFDAPGGDDTTTTSGGLLAILPGIGPLSSTQTTLAAVVLVLAIAGSVLR